MKPENAPAATIGFVGYVLTKLSDLGTWVALITILCLVPVMLRRWRNLFYEYYAFCEKYDMPRRVSIRVVVIWLFAGTTKSPENSGPPFRD